MLIYRSNCIYPDWPENLNLIPIIKNIEYFQKEELRLEDEIDELEIELSGLRMSLEHQEKMLKNF